MARFIGLISGTSVDAIDAVLCDVQLNPQPKIQLLHSLSYPYPQALQQQLLEFGKSEYQGDPIDQLGQLDQQVAECFAQATHQLLKESGHQARDIRAIGSHGQTVRHRPDAKHPFTLQIGDPSVIAANTGMTTVADFRRKDMAHGGQGAPFAPAFHQAFFASKQESRAVVNLGGIANVTLLQPEKAPLGFDTGPANTLMDQWIYQHQQKPFDKDGLWALSGKVHPQLLKTLLQDDYFARPAPKSTGCEYFNLEWLQQKTGHLELNSIAPEDVQRTLLELTVISVTDAIRQHISQGSIYLCGGGAHSKALQQQIQQQLPESKVYSTSQLGIAPDWVEAMTFAWFASKTLNQEPIALGSITGAKQQSILGGIYHA